LAKHENKAALFSRKKKKRSEQNHEIDKEPFLSCKKHYLQRQREREKKVAAYTRTVINQEF